MGKGSGGTRGSAGGGGGAMAKAKEEYEKYVHGGNWTEEKEGMYDHMDAVFQPAKEEITLYRGTDTDELKEMMKEAGVRPDEELNNFWMAEEKTFDSKYFKSTTSNKKDAEEYASDAHDKWDYEEFQGKRGPEPVSIKYVVAKGTPIVKRSDVAKDNTGRGAKDEYTLGRNVSMKIEYIDRHSDPVYEGRDNYEVVISVHKKR